MTRTSLSFLSNNQLGDKAVFFGASIGSTCSFLLGRYLFRDCVVGLASRYPIFRAVDRGEQ